MVHGSSRTNQRWSSLLLVTRDLLCHHEVMQSSQERLAADPFARLLGIELVDEEPVVVRMALSGDHMNFHGVTHGGATFSLADAAFALAANASGARAVAIDTHLVLTSGSKAGEVLTAVAEEVTRGRTLGTYRITVSRDDGRIVGLFTGTVHISD